ncbi:MAG TPA: hypothetical protein PK419_01440 [Spirochaetota bacterium]|nr:hypothetical protein [Spirochaetota bacterium]HPJ15322.1 hypothetical protein [Spirochaetota bacterium]HPY01929.1 hypothetical protein [Spirochaetota bacterium]HQA51495.1 hypothetical protein [Spirochaetota bacterium]
MKRLLISVCLSLLVFLTCGKAKLKLKHEDLIWGEWELKGSEGYINITRSKNYHCIIAGDALNCFIVTGMTGEYPDYVLSIKFRSGVQSPEDNGFEDGGELIVHFIDENKMWIEDKFNTKLEGMIHWYKNNNLSIWIKTGKENIYHRIRDRKE